MKNIFVLPINFKVEEINSTLYPTVIKENGEVVLVDCGYPDSISNLEIEMNKIGLSLK